MAFSDFVVVGVMRRSDFQSACSELFIYIIVCNNRDFASGERNNDCFTYQIFVFVICRVHRDCNIAKHRFRAGCSDYDCAGFVF